jgi:hypothetical protein
MLRYCLSAFTAILLAGCMTPAEQAARVQVEVDEMVRVYGPACDKLGFARDTDPWRECVLNLRARDDLRYSTRPTTTTCVGHRGFYHCTSY